MTARYEAALQFAAEKHLGQTRKGGQPYITHPVAVAEILRDWGYGEETQIAGLFHDLLEDTDASEEDILRLGGEKVLRAVKLVTKTPGYVMAEYMAGIREDETALLVKAADRLHNLRCAPEASEEFRRKYIAESRRWYMDLCPEIPGAVEAAEKTLRG